MGIAFFIALCVGLSTVSQGTFNKVLAKNLDMADTLFINGTVFLICSVIYSLAIKKSEAFTSFWPPGQVPMLWWYILPGIFGFIIVWGIPTAISGAGALKVFLAIICAQIIGSILWDIFAEGISLTPQKVIGSLFAIAGLIIVNWKN